MEKLTDVLLKVLCDKPSHLKEVVNALEEAAPTPSERDSGEVFEL